jgi:hypothetical protein
MMVLFAVVVVDSSSLNSETWVQTLRVLCEIVLLILTRLLSIV